MQQLLVGERVDMELLEQLHQAATEIDGVEEVADVKTMHQAPEDILAIFKLHFRDGSDVRAQKKRRLRCSRF